MPPNKPLVLFVVDAFLDQRFYDVQLTAGFFIKYCRHCFQDRGPLDFVGFGTEWFNNSVLKLGCSLQRFRGSKSSAILLLVMVSISNGPTSFVNSFVSVVSLPKLC